MFFEGFSGDVRDYLDRQAHMHGYEEREDDDHDCEKCIHYNDGKCNLEDPEHFLAWKCEYEKRYTAEDYVKKYVHVGDYGRCGKELWSQYDIDHYHPWDPEEYDAFRLESEWIKEHTVKVTAEAPLTDDYDMNSLLMDIGYHTSDNYGRKILSTNTYTDKTGQLKGVVCLKIGCGNDYFYGSNDDIDMRTEPWEEE